MTTAGSGGEGARTHLLADGSPPATPEALFARLRGLGIEFGNTEHAPVHTVEEAQAECAHLPGVHVKNLFLRGKKRGMWLVTCPDTRRVDLKTLAGVLGAPSVSFARPDRLMAHLGVLPGSVTPFAVINDRAREVEVVTDDALVRAPGPINVHPLVNHMTTSIAWAGLRAFLEAEGHPPTVLDLGSLGGG